MQRMQRATVQPKTDETLGQYLKRLRHLAGRVQGHTITQDRVAALSRHPAAAPQQQFTDSWLSKVESDQYQQVGGDRLRALSAIYSDLLRTHIPAEWLLAKAGFTVDDPTAPPSEPTALAPYLRREEILILIGIGGQLIEKGNPEDVHLLIRLGLRYLHSVDAEAHPADLFDNPQLSEQVRNSMEVLGL